MILSGMKQISSVQLLMIFDHYKNEQVTYSSIFYLKCKRICVVSQYLQTEHIVTRPKSFFSCRGKPGILIFTHLESCHQNPLRPCVDIYQTCVQSFLFGVNLTFVFHHGINLAVIKLLIKCIIFPFSIVK